MLAGGDRERGRPAPADAADHYVVHEHLVRAQGVPRPPALVSRQADGPCLAGGHGAILPGTPAVYGQRPTMTDHGDPGHLAEHLRDAAENRDFDGLFELLREIAKPEVMAAYASLTGDTPPRRVTPILNVSDIGASVEWFRALGWRKGFDWAEPGGPLTFGAVVAGGVEIFLCRDGQGGRGEHGAWLAIWVDDVDAVAGRARAAGIEITSQPDDKPWGVREMALRHPDGHTFRISASLGRD